MWYVGRHLVSAACASSCNPVHVARTRTDLGSCTCTKEQAGCGDGCVAVWESITL